MHNIHVIFDGTMWVLQLYTYIYLSKRHIVSNV
jgi:hypothetical protein